jgi:2-dehydropantoate 2-reductase
MPGNQLFFRGSTMKVCIAGLGAIGGLLAARLSAAGHEVSALARGATLAAVRERGLVLTDIGRARSVHRITVSDDPYRLPTPDLLVIALKAHALAAGALALAPLIGPNTIILPAMNGVPWWFLQSQGVLGAPLTSVDPHGYVAETLPLEQTLGVVVHLTCQATAPGEVRHGLGERIIIGEPLGDMSPRVNAVVELLNGAGFQGERSTDVRRAIWFKLWGNMTMNPVSALTGATCDAILDDALVRAFMAAAMSEASLIGARIGCPIEQTPEARMEVTRQLGAFKTSMLHDAEAGRALEIDALIGATREIGQRVGVATPHIDALFGLVRLMARSRGLTAPA